MGLLLKGEGLGVVLCEDTGSPRHLIFGIRKTEDKVSGRYWSLVCRISKSFLSLGPYSEMGATRKFKLIRSVPTRWNLVLRGAERLN